MTLKKPYRFRDIPSFIEFSGYAVDISWQHLKSHIEFEKETVADAQAALDMDPDFQRGHVWTMDKRIAYIEFVLKGGQSSNNLYFNCGAYSKIQLEPGDYTDYVLVDGKQRLSSVLMFLDDEVPIFGGLVRSDFVDKPDLIRARFRWNVNQLKTRAEVLQWYLDLNSGGVVHTSEEIERVRKLLEAEKK